MQSKITQSAYRYWNEVRGNRIAPKRFEIEPSQMAGLLPLTFILECTQNDTQLFRLAGTSVCELVLRELRGTPFLDLFEEADRAEIRPLLMQLTRQAAVVQLDIEGRTPTGHQVELEAVLLPLVHTGTTIERVLGTMTALTSPHWLGHEPVSQLLLKHHRVIWPDGRPQVVLERIGQQSPFAPENRLARIVSSKRRRFLVFDGGRSEES